MCLLQWWGSYWLPYTPLWWRLSSGIAQRAEVLIILQISSVSVLSLLLIVPYGALRSSLWEHFKSITPTAGVGVIFLFLASFVAFQNACSDWLDICYCCAKSKYTLNIDVCDSYIRGQRWCLKTRNYSNLSDTAVSWISPGCFHTNSVSHLFSMRSPACGSAVMVVNSFHPTLLQHLKVDPAQLFARCVHITLWQPIAGTHTSRHHTRARHPAARSPHNPRRAWFSGNVVFIFSFLSLLLIYLFIFTSQQSFTHLKHTHTLTILDGFLEFCSTLVQITKVNHWPMATQPFFHSILEPTMIYYIML